ncbi:hypothetical protein [Ciceribacter sp. L1K23]|nr:hypothetical protein [Ciceribacter sp. L1K23]
MSLRLTTILAASAISAIAWIALIHGASALLSQPDPVMTASLD